MPSIIEVLQAAIKTLQPVSETPRLDAEILLMAALNEPRSYLYAWPEKSIASNHRLKFEADLQRRLNGEPIPYITGHQEFWSLDLLVTPDTLIPRPETELLVENALKNSANELLFADLGTGTGAIALALASERPNWKIYATDQSNAALNVAKQNATNLNLKNIVFQQGNWCQALPNLKFDLIISNPPYIAENDAHLKKGGLPFEPISALASGADGLTAIREIIHTAKNYLKPGGQLMLEHGFEQAEAVRQIFKAECAPVLMQSNKSPELMYFDEIHSLHDLSGLERVTVGTALVYTQPHLGQSKK